MLPSRRDIVVAVCSSFTGPTHTLDGCPGRRKEKGGRKTKDSRPLTTKSLQIITALSTYINVFRCPDEKETKKKVVLSISTDL